MDFTKLFFLQNKKLDFGLQQSPDQATQAITAGTQRIASIPNAARLKEYTDSRIEMGLVVIFENSIQFENGYLVVTAIPGQRLIVKANELETNKLN